MKNGDWIYEDSLEQIVFYSNQTGQIYYAIDYEDLSHDSIFSWVRHLRTKNFLSEEDIKNLITIYFSKHK